MSKTKYSKSLSLVNTDTGEEYEVSEVEILDKEWNLITHCFVMGNNHDLLALTPTNVGASTNIGKKRNTTVRWMKTNMKRVHEAIRQSPLSGRAMRVNIALCARIAWGGYVDITIDELAEMTGIHRSDVSRAIKELESADIVATIERGRYRLNPSLYWPGIDEAQNSATIEYYRQRQASASQDRGSAKAKEKKAKAVTRKRKQIKLVHSSRTL